MQIARARVVAEAAPYRQHVVFIRLRQVLQCWKSLQETVEIRYHRIDLRLLQHDFRQPYPVRIGHLLPRQIMPARTPLPRGDLAREIGFGCQLQYPEQIIGTDP